MSFDKNSKSENREILNSAFLGLDFSPKNQIEQIVKIWLCIGLFMVFMQVVIGGVTRLTGSGLSITKWDIVTGVVPPLSETSWEKEFELYKATPQYEMINDGMEMGSIFKIWIFQVYLLLGVFTSVVGSYNGICVRHSLFYLFEARNAI